MFLKSLHLKNFKKFKDLDLNFPGDLTVIKGPNEEGKSTIVSALIAGLFYDPKKDNESIRELKSWHSDKLYEIKIIFEDKGNDLELIKNFDKKEIFFSNSDGSETIDNFKKISEYLFQLGGYRSAALFTSTSCVKQGTLGEIQTGKKDIEEALQDLITSGEDNVNVLNIIKKLDTIVTGLEKGLERPAKNPGLIKELQDLIENKREEYSLLNRRLNELNDNKEKLAGVGKEKNKTIEELKIDQKELNDNDQYFKSQEIITQKNKDLENIEHDLEKVKKTIEDDKELTKVLKNLGMKKDSEEGLPFYRNNLQYLTLAVIFAIIGSLGFFINKLFLFSFLISTGGLFWMVFNNKSKRKTTIKNAENEDLRHKMAGNQGLREGVLRGRTITDLEKERRNILRVLDTEEGKIGSARRQNPPTARMQSVLQAKISELSNTKERLDKEEARLEAIVSSQKDNQEKLLEIEESAEELKQKLEYQKNKLNAYKVLSEALKIVKDNTIKNTKTKLGGYINKFIFEITQNKYSSVELDNDLALKVYSSEKNNHVEVDKNLSRGTVDQFYLVSRFALLKILSPNKKPLIILDDPFVNFDSNRREHAKHICQELSKEFQILLFTHSNDYDKWGAIVKLET